MKSQALKKMSLAQYISGGKVPIHSRISKEKLDHGEVKRPNEMHLKRVGWVPVSPVDVLSLLEVRNGGRCYNSIPFRMACILFSCYVSLWKHRERKDQPINKASEQDLINVAGCISALCSHAGGGFLPRTLRLTDVCFGEAKGTQRGWSPYYTERIRKV